VLVPPAFNAFRIGRDRIWGTLQDSLGVQAVAWIELASLR